MVAFRGSGVPVEFRLGEWVPTKSKPVKLTKTVVEGAKPRATDYFIWDSAMSGFGVRVFPTGTKVYVCKWGLGRRGKGTRSAIGEHGVEWSKDPRSGQARTLTVELARELAAERRGQARRGLDPGEQLEQLRDIPTFRMYAEDTYLPWASKKKKAGTMILDGRHLKLLVRRFGAQRLDLISPKDAEQLHIELGATEVKANRVMALLSTMVNKAREWRILPRTHENPCDVVELYAEQPRERLLSDDELARAGDAIAVAEEEGAKTRTQLREEKADRVKRRKRSERVTDPPHASPSAIAAIRGIIFTGARPGEVCELKLHELDLERRLIIKRSWKTRGRTRQPMVRAIPLSEEAVLVFADQVLRVEARRAASKSIDKSEYVFPGRLKGKPFGVSGLDGVWERIRIFAGLPDVRLSDLGRHNFASEAAELGYSLQTIGKILGHTQERTTKRYAHLRTSAAQAAAEAISKRIAGRLTPR